MAVAVPHITTDASLIQTRLEPRPRIEPALASLAGKYWIRRMLSWSLRDSIRAPLSHLSSDGQLAPSHSSFS
jgi:hypothetical protein